MIFFAMVLGSSIVLGANAQQGSSGCEPGTVLIEERVTRQGNVTYVQPICRRIRASTRVAPVASVDPDERVVIAQMIALARRQGWDVGEQRRLDAALRNLRLAARRAGNRAEIRQVWINVRARAGNRILVAGAEAGAGPGLYGAGEQGSEDCAVFALATASGRPYGVVAALAGELIRQADWRNATERDDPQGVLEREGLWAGEIVMLAENLGQAEIVPPQNFSTTLRAGRPVVVGVSSPNGAHAVVLSRAFRHNRAEWFEVIDSNEGPRRRLYLSAAELNRILLQNGVAYQPDPGRTVRITH